MIDRDAFPSVFSNGGERYRGWNAKSRGPQADPLLIPQVVDFRVESAGGVDNLGFVPKESRYKDRLDFWISALRRRERVG